MKYIETKLSRNYNFCVHNQNLRKNAYSKQLTPVGNGCVWLYKSH